MNKNFADTIYQEEFDETIKRFILNGYTKEIHKTHIVTELVYLPQKQKWLVKLEKRLFPLEDEE